MITKISKLVRSMSMSRQRLNDALRNTLTGAFGEFMKRQVALAIQEPFRANDWTTETRILLKKVSFLMGDEVVVSFKDKQKVLLVACDEAVSHLEVVQAKNKLQDYLPKKIHQIHKLKFEAMLEFVKMFEEFLPEYAEVLKKHWLQK